MKNGRIESQVIDGRIWVPFQDILTGIETVAQNALDLAEASEIPYMAVQAHGIAELGQGLQDILDVLEREAGLPA